jgi:zinc transport system ATP-binding protein
MPEVKGFCVMSATEAAESATCHEHVIELEHVSFSYEQQRVIDNLSLNVLQRDFVGMIGANGAGKSTLLRMIVGLLKPNQGDIRLFGQPIAQFKDWERVGYVPQKNSLNPLFPATVKEVVLSGLYSRKSLFKRIGAVEQLKADSALEAMGITDLANQRIGQLSGGQQQRALLARALINNPDLLILDEPTVGIDAETQANFFHLIRHLHQHHHITFLMVSHDSEMMRAYLGDEPIHTSGKIQFYVKHTHHAENCEETRIDHPLKELRESSDEAEGPVQPVHTAMGGRA